MKETKVTKILKQASKLEDKKFARELRVSALQTMIKFADEHGVLQHFKGTPASNFENRSTYPVGRGGKDGGEKLYGTGPEHKKSDTSAEVFDRSLSTRYSPDRVGVQARRISDGVYQDPITNKVYDWNEGFTTEDGEKFNGGRVSLQTDLLFGK